MSDGFSLIGSGSSKGLAKLTPTRSLSLVPRVEAAHLRAAATHDRAALLHEQAAELFDGMGFGVVSETQERARARWDRDGAVVERQHARLRREHNALHSEGF